ncbi:MAG: NAD(P)-dependent oxidoreductase [Nitriliruptoraceae bacterium]
MRTLVADRFPAQALAALANQGVDVAYLPELATATLADELAGADILVVRSTRVPAEVIDHPHAASLRLIIRAGSGTDTIDVAAASARALPVANVPGRNAIAVAELAFALMLALDRQVVTQTLELRDGQWRKADFQACRGIFGRRVGVVGLGDIGLAFAERAAAFGCEIFSLRRPNRPPTIEERITSIGIAQFDDMYDLANACDVVSFHVPLCDETARMINSGFISCLQPGTILINTARGELIDEDALLPALDNKPLFVGLDVYPGEPTAGRTSFSSRLAQHPNVIGTHHVGASTLQAQHAVADAVVAMIDEFSRGRLPACVNQAAVTARSQPA